MSDAISGRRRARPRPDLGARRVELREARVREEARELVDLRVNRPVRRGAPDILQKRISRQRGGGRAGQVER